jgi:hypothetical protein
MRYHRISPASSLQTRTSRRYRPRLQRGRLESAFVTLNKEGLMMRYHRISRTSSLKKVDGKGRVLFDELVLYSKFDQCRRILGLGLINKILPMPFHRTLA